MPTKNLVIVESPAKAKTISKFLGRQYSVEASMGHVRDLPKSKMGVDTKNDFEPSYLVPQDKKKVILGLKKKISKDTAIWIATDEDREGEAIGWHLLQALNIDNSERDVHRIVFHEITRDAILESIKNPRQIHLDLVNAQQARRILDRLVGYELSPLLWNKIRYGLSAGRVQSVAVRLIVEREREIRAFKPEEYWTIEADFLSSKKKSFSAMLQRDKDGKLSIVNEKQAKDLVKLLSGAPYSITSVEEKQVKRYPAPPFITSTLQQEAARKLRFSVKKTMLLAQQLYEGIDVGDGATGLITYMRTDSVHLAVSALNEARQVIEQQFGKEYALEKPRFFKSKKGAQEAHEAIRPVRMSLAPDAVKQYLDKDQFRLYDLIWKRAIACQMKEALLKQVGVDVTAETSKGQYVFRATGQSVIFPGFMQVYIEGRDIPEEEADEKERFLPALSHGEKVTLEKLNPLQHFTQPPPRYTEASLVKKLEQEGIGRPSTYAPTISTIISRGYIEKEAAQLKPTDTAEVVTDMLVEHFPDIVDVRFTAVMEDDLDKIAEGEKEWVSVLRSFYDPFHNLIEVKKETIKKSDVVNEATDEKCDKCGSPMVIKLGRFGKFLSCSNYPTCKNAKPLGGPAEKDPMMVELERKLKDKKCEKCGKPMEIKKGKYGHFLGCSGYPECKNMKPIIKFTGVRCPKCGGQFVERTVRRTGKVFYGCNKFPKCKNALWDKPVEIPCPKCKGLQVQKKDEVVCVECGKV